MGTGQPAGPTVVRMSLGERLRQLREANGMTRADAGWAIRSSLAKISRLETGRSSFKRRDVADLLTLYGRAADKVVFAVHRSGVRRSRARSRVLSYSASRMVAAMPS